MTDNFWYGVNALATIGGAGIVAWYAWETKKLREIAQAQLEASVAPLISISAPPHVYTSAERVFDLSGGEKDHYIVALHNNGKGAALRGRLRFISRTLPGVVSPPETHDAEYSFPPVAAGGMLLLCLPQKDLVGVGASGNALQKYEVEFEGMYESASGRRYRTRVKAKMATLDLSEVEYGEIGR